MLNRIISNLLKNKKFEKVRIKGIELKIEWKTAYLIKLFKD